MTLREMRAAVSGLIADPGEEKVGWGEIVQYLNLGQNFFAGHIWNVERDKFLMIQKQDAAHNVSDYGLLSSAREIVYVSYYGVTCTRIPSKEAGTIGTSPAYRPVFKSAHFYNEIGHTVGKSKIRIYPTPVNDHGIGGTTQEIHIWYYLKPRLLHERGIYNGTVTALGGVPTSEFIDPNIPFSGSGENFFDNGQFRFTNNNLKNVTGRCTFEAAGGAVTVQYLTPTLALQLPMSPAQGDKFELDQVSDIPRQYHHLIVLYAAALAAAKAGRDGGLFTAQWQMELEMMQAKYTDNVNAVMPGMGWGNTSIYNASGGGR